MRSRVAILLAVVAAAVVCQSSAVSVTRGVPGDRPGFAKPPGEECQWYRNLCRFFNPCWYKNACQGYPDAECRPNLCTCRAEYYNGDEKIDCQKVTDQDKPQVESADSESGQACEPVSCRLSCLDGYIKDSNDCDTCECVEPADRHGVCPDVGTGQVGTCDIQCLSDAGCGEGKKCCSNGCGRVCVTACSGINCRINCRPFGGFAKDENGCEVCRCVGRHIGSSPKVCPAIDLESVGICVIGCDVENECVNDGELCCSNGCGKTCVKACEPVRCRMFCEHGFDTDNDGCEICKCKVPPGCDEITCRINCPYGLQRDDQGCEICRCFEPRKSFLRTGSRTSLPGVCPSLKGAVGICVSTCAVDGDCTEEQKCCSNGCAMTCTQTCPAVTCRMACPAGYVKDSHGCDICRCKLSPRNFGKCPALVEGTFGICVNNCESDGDCEDLSMKCCSNGCGQTCRTACTPVLCRLGCRWGFAKNTEGCEICQCSPPPAEKPGECPVIDEKQAGICVTECQDDSSCPSDKKCCSNGCGKTCTSSCPIFRCRLGCRFGYVTDMNGCRACECKPPPQDPSLHSEDCSLVSCRLTCEYGLKMDNNGCEICECNEEEVKTGVCPVVSTEIGGICVESCSADGECPNDQKCCSNGCGHVCTPACSEIQCRLFCRYGFLKDENGCGKCECAAPPECEPLRCRLGCRNGNQKDDKGCDICACRAFPNEFNPARTGAIRGGPKRGFPKVCPVVQQGVGGICVEGCDYRDNTCPEGQICCSNGCGHVCTEGCEPVLCRMYCRYGWATNENNCEICACKGPPSACPELSCELDCPHGLIKDDNNCDMCNCAAPPPELTCPSISGSIGICSEDCGPSDPCGEGELCCSNGCGHVCVQGCRPVLCYLYCRHGWAKGENGCDICQCADPPLDSAVCPVVPKDVGGICVEACGPDKKCDDGQLCCSNGCGHVCKAGCAPVLCRMRCQHGWATNEEGCEICECKRPGLICPSLSIDVGGICVEECRFDNDCDSGQLCCSNGCGHSCREGCRPVLCYLYCRHGWAKGENGCDVCQCADPPIQPVCPILSVPAESGGICVEECDENNDQCEGGQKCCSNGCGHVCVHGCPPVLCRMHCEHGWATDNRGCEICECKQLDGSSTTELAEGTPTCSPVMCLIFCQHGFVKDNNGCDMCQCKPAPELTCPTASGVGICSEECSSDNECNNGELCCSNGCGHSCRQGCAPVVCRMYCRYGWDKDEQGCEVCKCKQPDLQCPAPQEETFGICADSCTPDTQCGRGQKCCPNGCGGNQCMPACPPLSCGLTGCRYGHVTDENGCETCGCRGPPEECKPVRCRKICRYGLQKENGCNVCKCNAPSRELCEPVTCRMFCTYGFAENEDGCEVCQCNPPPDVECRDGKIYQECGTACPMTCENVRSDELIGCPAICIQGCFCPPGSVLDSDGMCVKQRQCGCLYDADGNGQKEYYQLGDSFEIGVRHKDRCQCRRDGAVLCTRRKHGSQKQ
ncbi:uncharacterized protein [Asterias amurensis]|uniref:uncharacterized protein n=1 Tax=Asterias amurensis TaxID=7602 RepID=UPI003AB84F0A